MENLGISFNNMYSKNASIQPNSSGNTGNFNLNSSVFSGMSFPMDGGFGLGGEVDFMSIMMQQMQMMELLFKMMPDKFSIAAPKVDNSYGDIKKKVAAMKLSKESCEQINHMAKDLKMNPEDIKALIYSESGGNPQAYNKNGGASGLIQFMPKTAERFGTTTEKIRQMSAEEQMPLIKKYLETAKKDAGFSKDDKIDAGTLYSLVFLPAFAKKDILCKSGSKYYEANKGLDVNKDGYITKSDLDRRLQSYC